MNFGEAGDWLIDEAVGALEVEEAPFRAPDHRRVHFGEADTVAWDNCCNPPRASKVGGQLTVAIGSWYPSTGDFPAPDVTYRSGCAHGWAVPATLEVVRCTPTMNDKGVIPWERLVEDNEARLLEAWLLSCHFAGALSGTGDDPDGMIQSVTSIVSGGCRSIRMSMILHLP